MLDTQSHTQLSCLDLLAANITVAYRIVEGAVVTVCSRGDGCRSSAVPCGVLSGIGRPCGVHMQQSSSETCPCMKENCCCVPTHTCQVLAAANLATVHHIFTCSTW